MTYVDQFMYSIYKFQNLPLNIYLNTYKNYLKRKNILKMNELVCM